jgi:hypothetical protein
MYYYYYYYYYNFRAVSVIIHLVVDAHTKINN